MFANFGDDFLNGNWFVLNDAYGLTDDTFCQIHVDIAFEQDGLCQQRVDDTFQFTYAFVYILSNVVDNIFRNVQTIAMDFIAQDVLSKLFVWFFQLSNQSPLETGQQAFFHTLQHDWSTVGGKNQLFSILVQMIEDMEESVLCLGYTSKFLNIINNEHVNGLVEVYEVIEVVGTYRIGVLHLKQMSRNV